jgi:SAM-dependent methyltransferase
MNSIPDTSSPIPEASTSAWVVRFAAEIRDAGRVLDVACGKGRHANWLVRKGFEVCAVDRAASGELSHQIAFTQADIETGPWPYGQSQFDAVIVTNYLYRPLFAKLIASLAPGGLLIYETFAIGNEQFGRPTRPDFLLKPGELLEVARGTLTVLAYEHGFESLPKPAMMQRIAARR